LMIKAVASCYTPNKRSVDWIKARHSVMCRDSHDYAQLKTDYLDGMADSADLVPIGAYLGKGRRKGAYGAFLLASRNERTGLFSSVCKV